MKALVVGRHSGDIPGVEIVETRSVTFPVTARECVPVIQGLLADARASGSVVLFQNTPGQVAVALAHLLADEASDGGLQGSPWQPSEPLGGWRVGVVISTPGPRPGAVREVFPLTGDVREAMAAIKFANPRAVVELAGYDEEDRHGASGYSSGVNPLAVSVDGPPMPFSFSHIEWLM